MRTFFTFKESRVTWKSFGTHWSCCKIIKRTWRMTERSDPRSWSRVSRISLIWLSWTNYGPLQHLRYGAYSNKILLILWYEVITTFQNTGYNALIVALLKIVFLHDFLLKGLFPNGCAQYDFVLKTNTMKLLSIDYLYKSKTAFSHSV